MAATKTTRNKLQNLRRIVYWLAQAQGKCPECKKALVNGNDGDAYCLTVEHLSGNYDHVRKRERGNGKGKGVVIMHRTCHKSMTMRRNKVWRHRRNLRFQNTMMKMAKKAGIKVYDLDEKLRSGRDVRLDLPNNLAPRKRRAA